MWKFGANLAKWHTAHVLSVANGNTAPVLSLSDAAAFA
jgi:hypothetical protein